MQRSPACPGKAGGLTSSGNPFSQGSMREGVTGCSLPTLVPTSIHTEERGTGTPGPDTYASTGSVSLESPRGSFLASCLRESRSHLPPAPRAGRYGGCRGAASPPAGHTEPMVPASDHTCRARVAGAKNGPEHRTPPWKLPVALLTEAQNALQERAPGPVGCGWRLDYTQPGPSRAVGVPPNMR